MKKENEILLSATGLMFWVFWLSFSSFIFSLFYYLGDVLDFQTNTISIIKTVLAFVLPIIGVYVLFYIIRKKEIDLFIVFKVLILSWIILQFFPFIKSLLIARTLILMKESAFYQNIQRLSSALGFVTALIILYSNIIKEKQKF